MACGHHRLGRVCPCRLLLPASIPGHAIRRKRPRATIKLSYASELANLSDSNTLYSLADAHFGIYSDYQCTQRAGELVTDEDGHATSTPLPAGRYFIKEELASPGFALSTQLYQVDVAIGASATVETSSNARL